MFTLLESMTLPNTIDELSIYLSCKALPLKPAIELEQLANDWQAVKDIIARIGCFSIALQDGAEQIDRHAKIMAGRIKEIWNPAVRDFFLDRFEMNESEFLDLFGLKMGACFDVVEKEG